MVTAAEMGFLMQMPGPCAAANVSGEGSHTLTIPYRDTFCRFLLKASAISISH
jgi:hypothetical protein